MNELALFAGVGGGILGGKLIGWRTVCAVERDAYCAAVLAQRQNDGCLEPFPIWSDVETFDGKPWRGIVDVVSGGFPCQDISCAGRGAGIDGKRSGLWSEMARIVGEVRPRFVFVENTPPLIRRGLARVLGDLAKMGYDARWCVLGADDCGAPHIRKRLWIVAYSMRNGWNERRAECKGQQRGSASEPASHMAHAKRPQRRPVDQARSDQWQDCDASGQKGSDWVGECGEDVADANIKTTRRLPIREKSKQSRPIFHCGNCGREADCIACFDDGHQFYRCKCGHQWDTKQCQAALGAGWWDIDPADQPWAVESGMGRLAHGVPARVDQLKGLGNAQVPIVAATAWRILTQDL